jgi:hypothetical protein
VQSSASRRLKLSIAALDDEDLLGLAYILKDKDATPLYDLTAIEMVRRSVPL